MKLQKELKDTGFVIIASHAQNVPQDQIVSYLRSQKVNFTVTSFGSVPGDNGRGIPRAFLFDSKGDLVESGHPMTLKTSAQKLIETEPHWLAAGREYTKIKPYADALKKTKAYGSILKKLKTAGKRGGVAAEEADYLTKRILAYGEKKLKEAEALQEEDAYLAQKLTSDVATQWKYSEVGDAAKKRLSALKKDKTFQKELKASTMAHKILAQCEKLVMVRGKVNLEYSSNKRIAATVRSAVPMLKKKYPESKAAATIGDQLKGYGFKDL